MTLNHLQPMHHYIRLSMEPRCTDVLLIRKSLQNALTDMFGFTFSSTYIDILSVNEQGSEVVVRANPEYVQIRLNVGCEHKQLNMYDFDKRRIKNSGCCHWGLPCFHHVFCDEGIFISPFTLVKRSRCAKVKTPTPCARSRHRPAGCQLSEDIRPTRVVVHPNLPSVITLVCRAVIQRWLCILSAWVCWHVYQNLHS
jgi:hypothetical protein